MRLLNAVPAIFVIALAAAIMIATSGLTFWDGFTPGPRFFPGWLSGAGALLAVMLLITQRRGTDVATLDLPDARGFRTVMFTIAGLLALALLARPSIAPYTATKGAVGNLTKGMATDWARHGLQCNAIAPGYFATPLNAALMADPDFTAWLEKRTPAGRWGRVEELVGACVFLASDAASFVNGHVLYVDGGITASL